MISGTLCETCENDAAFRPTWVVLSLRIDHGALLCSGAGGADRVSHFGSGAIGPGPVQAVLETRVGEDGSGRVRRSAEILDPTRN